MIPYGRQSINQQDIEAVMDVLRSDYLTQGPAIERFERTVADYCGVRYAVAVCNATVALHLACLAAGLGRGDYLWTAPVTFVASANCGLYCGANVDFVDVEPQTGAMDAGALRHKLENSANKGQPLPKVLVPVHLMGQSCDMEAIHALAQDFGITVIEDAAHAIGGKYHGQPIGNCRFSDMAVFSFHPVKIVTTGEGGMVLTNRDDLYETLLLLRSHGITRNSGQMDNPRPDQPWYYEQVTLGFNARMTDIQAALGTSQMARIDEFIDRRRAIANRYDDLLKGLPLQPPGRREQTESAWHLYTIRLDDPSRRTAVFNRLREAGIGVNVHYIPVHTQPYYRDLGFKPRDYPNAQAYYAGAISLPMYYDLTKTQQDTVVEALQNALG